MSELELFITKTSDSFLQTELIELKEDRYLKELLGLQTSISEEYLFRFLSTDDDFDTINTIIAYLISDYEFSEYAIFEGCVDAGAFSYKCSLHIFQFGDRYLACYHNTNETETDILTTFDEVENFFNNALYIELAYFETEKENLKNEYWEGEDVSIDFQVEIPY
jgi:hypothetical protein